MSGKTVATAIAGYGIRLKSKLCDPGVVGAPEDQLRAPIEVLFREFAEIGGLPADQIALIGETSLSDLKIRPDYAVTISRALTGFIEIKAPGKGADPRRFSDAHDREQWSKLKSLPNLIYTDGGSFSLWQDGEIVGSIIHLDGDVATAGGNLKAPDTLLPLITSFLQWRPIPPRNARALAEVSARLCRLLRDEVTEQMARGNVGLTALATDWRKLLFPEAVDEQFADGYAQAVTFGLLVARAQNISLRDGIEHAAQELRKTNSLIGTALRLLTDEPSNQQVLKTSLGTLTRVLNEVDWSTISKDDPEAWLYFYEAFLEVYDNLLRKRTGSYYTPPEVVAAMVRLVDDALRSPLFSRTQGLAAPDVTVADPAVGTGTFLLGILRRIANIVAQDQGPGAVRGAIEAAAKRLIGFELQFGPFAVAQLRLIAEMQSLMATPGDPLPAVPELQLFITDTLGNPFVEEDAFLQSGPIAKSRRDANQIKKSERITVVIGNPPYKVDAAGKGGWIEAGSQTRASAMDLWTPPVQWRVGQSAKHLKNLYVFFWRWATWKVFGSGHSVITGEPELDRAGIVCFITVAGFLNGPGFQKMREELRRDCSDIWVIDCSPEGHQPDIPTRIFTGVQQPVCIVLAARTTGKKRSQSARVRFVALPKGRQAEKFAALTDLALDDAGWVEAAKGWREPFLPIHADGWAAYAPLPACFEWYSPGVKTHRTWIIAPDTASLERRWEALKREPDAARKAQLFHEDDTRSVGSVVKVGLGSNPTRPVSVAMDKGNVVTAIRYAFRTFDKQWIIPDHRLISRARTKLWDAHCDKQVYLTALDSHSPTNGPAITFAHLIPDMHHYHGRGGRAFPLWRDAGATLSNLSPLLLARLSEVHGRTIPPQDVMAYLAATMAHPAFTARFAADLVRPGLRVPLTAERSLFEEAVGIGREVVWLHTYGERFADPDSGRPHGAPRLPKALSPTIPLGGGIPPAPEPLPDEMDYDPASRRLKIGKGFVENVMPEAFAYEVSGKQVVRQWFSYRRRDRSRPIIGDRRPPSPLDRIQPEGWLPEYTTDLLDLLHVLGRLVLLEPKQADLLERICAGTFISAGEITGPDEVEADE